MNARLEHVNLVVKDIPETLAFLQTALPAWRVRGEGHSEWYGRPRRWLHFGTDDFYITLNDGTDGETRDLRGHTPGLAHIGLEVEDVDGVRAQMEARGYEIATIGADHPYRKTIYFIDPTGIEFEFIQYLSERPEHKNLYGGETSAIRRVATA